MVDHSHLSAGNSSSSSSRNLFSEFGVSEPISSPVSDGLGNLATGIPPCEDMVESSPIPQTISVSSDESNSGLLANTSLVGNANSELQDVFKAAHHFAQQDRVDVVAERKKNQDLLAFITAHGLSVSDLNAFVSHGTITRNVDEHNLFVKSSRDCGGPSSVFSEPSPALPERDSHLPSPTYLHSRVQDATRDFPILGNTTDSFPVLSATNAISGKGLEAGDFQSPKPFQNSEPCEDFALPVTVTEGTPSDVVKDPENGAFLPSGPISAPASTSGVAPVPKSWSSLLSQPSPTNLNLSFFPPSPSSTTALTSGPIVIHPPMDVLRKGTSIWNTSLIGHFVHSRLPYKVVEPAAMRMWGNYGLLKVLLHEKGYYIFKFKEQNDRDNVLALGPWYIANRLIKLQHWKENVNPAQEVCSKTPIWVKLHHLPFSYWTGEGLSYVASGLGKPLFTDKTTAKLDPMPFARLCVEMSIDSPFPDSLSVAVQNDDTNSFEFVEVKVEYQNRPASCPSCRTFGHSRLKCPKANYQWVPKSSSGPSPLSGNPAPISSPSTVIVTAKLTPELPPKDPPLPDQEWKTVSNSTNAKDKRKSSDDSITPLSNSFQPIGATEYSDTDTTPSPNPLVSKLILIDEIEGKDIKNKGKGRGGSAHVSKRNRQGGGKFPIN